MIYSALNEGIILSTKNSRQKVIDNYKRLEKIIVEYIKMNEKRLDILNECVAYVKTAEKSKYNEDEKYEDFKKLIEKYSLLNDDFEKSVYWDSKLSAKSYNKYMHMKIFNRADLKNKELSSDLRAFINKCLPNGEYFEKIEKLCSKIDKINNDYSDIVNKEVKDSKVKPITSGYANVLKLVASMVKNTYNSIYDTKNDADFITSIKDIVKESSIFESVNII